MRPRPARAAVVVAAACVLLGASRLATAAEAGDPPRVVLEFLEEWVADWQGGDLGEYLAHYADDAVVSGRRGSDFREHKRAVFARAEAIRLAVGDVSSALVEEEGEDLVRVVFDQHYESESLEDFGEKTLWLRETRDGLTIVREHWRARPGDIGVTLGEQLAEAASAEPAGAAAPDAPRLAESSDVDDDELEPMLGGAYRPPVEAAAAAEGGRSEAEDLTLVEDFEPLLPPRDPGARAGVIGLPEDPEDARVIEEIVATVNGRVLTRSMLIDRIELHQEQLLLDQPPDLAERLANLVPETIETTIDRWLVLGEIHGRQADLRGFWRDWLEAFRQQVGAESLEEVRELLREQGHDLEKLEEQVIEQEVPALYLQQEVAERIDVSVEAVRAWYDEHEDRYRLPQRVTLRQIFVPVEAGTDPERARQVALEAIGRLADGEEWCAIEELYGVGGGPCGSVGTVALSDLLPELREAAGSLPVDAVSRPIRSELGYHVVQVTERHDDAAADFELVAARVRDDMFQQLYEERLTALLDDLRASAVLEINPRYEPEGARVDASVGQ